MLNIINDSCDNLISIECRKLLNGHSNGKFPSSFKTNPEGRFIQKNIKPPTQSLKFDKVPIRKTTKLQNLDLYQFQIPDLRKRFQTLKKVSVSYKTYSLL